MGVQQLEIPGVVDDAAHQVAGLLVMEIAQVQPFKLVVGLCAQVAHQEPGGLVGHVIAAEAEQDAQQVQRHKDRRQSEDRLHGCFRHADLNNACHGGQYLGRSQIDRCQAQGGEDRQHVQLPVTKRLPAQFQQEFHMFSSVSLLLQRSL